MIDEFASYFIDDRAIFGAYPTQERIELLEEIGIDLVVDLTRDDETKCVRYTTKLPIIKFPIPDRHGPVSKQDFCKLILTLSEKLDDGYRLFIHCKGGHGRSGMVAAALLCYREGIEPKEAFRRVTECHSRRTVMKSHWRRIGSPQTWEQKQTIYSIFRQHIITPLSPFFSGSNYVNSFLVQTYLGRIIGENGNDLEFERKKLLLEA